MTPEVSVIIPTYNRRTMVQQAIASVLAQKGTRFELIVIDDGSTDGTFGDLERLSASARGNPIRVDRIAHLGPAAARNRGVEVAAAPLIAFLDSDDLWSPEKLSRHVAFMLSHPEYAISQTQEIWLRGGRRVNPARRHQKRAGDIFFDSLRICLISPSAVMMRADFFRSKGGFDESMAACEDYDLWLRTLIDHEVGLLDEPLVTRRAGHPDQLSAVTPAPDRFRILALAKLLTHQLAPKRRKAVADALAEKCRIYRHGLARRGRADDAAFFDDMARRALSARRDATDDSLGEAVAEIRRRIAARDEGLHEAKDLSPNPSPEGRERTSASCLRPSVRDRGLGGRVPAT